MVYYDVFSQLHRRNRRALKVEELSDEEISGIANARLDSKYDALDAELDDDDGDG